MRDPVIVDEDETPARGAGAVSGAVVVEEDGDDIDPALEARITWLEDGTATLALAWPVEVTYRSQTSGRERSERVDVLTFRRATGADQRAVSAVPEERRAQEIVCRLAGIKPVLFDRLDASDLTAAALIIDRFFGGGRRTGRR